MLWASERAPGSWLNVERLGTALGRTDAMSERAQVMTVKLCGNCYGARAGVKGRRGKRRCVERIEVSGDGVEGARHVRTGLDTHALRERESCGHLFGRWGTVWRRCSVLRGCARVQMGEPRPT